MFMLLHFKIFDLLSIVKIENKNIKLFHFSLNLKKNVNVINNIMHKLYTRNT